ncbi:hypothetical protein ACFPRL_18745 [Pseudoclavibacter helvolus]
MLVFHISIMTARGAARATFPQVDARVPAGNAGRAAAQPAPHPLKPRRRRGACWRTPRCRWGPSRARIRSS